MSVTLHTSLGDVKVELACAEAPKACFNFLALAASGSYNGTIFHRNIPGFMIQGGGVFKQSSSSSSSSSSKVKWGESVWGDDFEDEFHPLLKHDARGVLSMANKGPGGTNARQFFFTYAPAPHLDSVYTAFGRIIHGLEFLDAAERVAPKAVVESAGKKKKSAARHRPEKDIVIESVTVHANPLAQQRLPENK